MNVTPVRPRQETLGTALAVAGRPTMPPTRPKYVHNHPTLKSPAIQATLPGRAVGTGGVNQTQLAQYVKAIRG